MNCYSLISICRIVPVYRRTALSSFSINTIIHFISITACNFTIHFPKLSYFTPQEIDELMKIMKNLAKEGKSILFITHKLNEIMEVADRCTILRKGKYIGTVNISETSKEELSRMMVGRNVSFSVNKKPSKPGAS